MQQRFIRAAPRGINVRLLVPSKSDVPIMRWAAVGTANLDCRSFFLNYELALASEEPGRWSQLEQHFLNDLKSRC